MMLPRASAALLPHRHHHRRTVGCSSSAGGGSATAASAVSSSSSTRRSPGLQEQTQEAVAAAAGPMAAQPAQQRHRQQRVAAACAFAAASALGAPPLYHALAAHPLPPLDDLARALAKLLLLCAGGCVGALGVARQRHGADRVHVELHKNRLYVQLGVPSSGPPLPAGSVVTRPTGDVRGNGAFAMCAIPAGSHVCDYAGERLTTAEFFQRYPDGVADYAMAVDGDAVLDAAAAVAATAAFHPVHMNHSAVRPNVVRFYRRAEGRVAFFAARDIQPGEELLYDYGRDYWRGREQLELP